LKRIDTDNADGTIIAYVPGKGRVILFLPCIFDNKEKFETLSEVGTESCNSIYFHATSDSLTFEEIKFL